MLIFWTTSSIDKEVVSNSNASSAFLVEKLRVLNLIYHAEQFLLLVASKLESKPFI